MARSSHVGLSMAHSSQSLNNAILVLQGLIQDLKKGSTGGLAPNTFLANLGRFRGLFKEFLNKSTLDNCPPPLLNLKSLRPQGQIIDVKCKQEPCGSEHY